MANKLYRSHMAIARDLYKPNWADTSEKNAALDYVSKQDTQFLIDVYTYALERNWMKQEDYNKLVRYLRDLGYRN